MRLGVRGPHVPMHVHATQHLLTLTNLTVTGRTLHLPRAYTQLDACKLACRTPQATRPPRGHRKAATERCRGGRRGARSGRCGGCRLLHGRAGRRRLLHRVAEHGRRACGVPPPRRSAQGGRVATPLAPLTGTVSGVSASSRAGSPVSPTGGSERAGAGRAVLPRHTGGGWMARDPPVGRCWSLVRPRARPELPSLISDRVFTLLFTARVYVTDECKTLWPRALQHP